MTPEETKRATYKPALSQPRGRVTPEGERGDPPASRVKYITGQSPGSGTVHQRAVSFWINQTRQPKKNLKFLLAMFDGGGRLC